MTTLKKAWMTEGSALAMLGALAASPCVAADRLVAFLRRDDDLVATVGGSVRYTGSQHPYYSQATGTNPAGLEPDSYTLVDLRTGLPRPRTIGLMFGAHF